jgi:hypothetical protein
MKKHLGWLLLALSAIVFAGGAEARSQLPVQATGSQSSASTTASATVGFRIVIRESLALGGPQQAARADSPKLTQSVSFENGREVVTLARP